jgi:hypothetical protein
MRRKVSGNGIVLACGPASRERRGYEERDPGQYVSGNRTRFAFREALVLSERMRVEASAETLR